MTLPRAYLDHNATTPLRPAVRAAMEAAFEVFGNPSSIHAEGRRARALIDDARRCVARMTGADEVIFTSGGTEALNIVLTPELTSEDHASARLLIGGGEHPAVFAGHRFGADLEVLALQPDGTLDLASLDAALARCGDRRVMLALQAANNETGVIQPVAAAAARVHAQGGFVVCDAVQAAGKITCDLTTLGADAIAISAHKFGGPKGVGALCFAASRHHLKAGVVRGGGQERGLRAGTENLIGIAGLGAACTEADAKRDRDSARISILRDRVERSVRALEPEAIVFGQEAQRLPNTSLIAIPGCDAQLALMNLDLAGVSVSAGSACASGKVKPSHVLTAMGVPGELARSALRISLGWTSNDADIDLFASAFGRVMSAMRPRVAA